MKRLSLSLLGFGLVFSLMGESAMAGAFAVNDHFAAATLISGAAGTTEGQNFGATSEPDDPLFLADVRTIWWRWVAPDSGNCQFDTFGSALEDTLLGVYVGPSLEDLEAIDENDDANDNTSLSQVNFVAVAGQTYFIAVAGFAQTEGPIRLNWNLAVPPVLNSPNLPVMVYSLRTVVISEGADPLVEPVDDLSYGWTRRRTTVSTSLLIRGRDEGAHLDSDGIEIGPIALVTFYNTKARQVSDRSFAIEVFIPGFSEEDGSVQEGEDALQGQLVRHNRSKTSVSETLQAQAVVAEENQTSAGLAVFGKASLRAPYRNAPKTWFASKLAGKSESAVGDAAGFQHVVVAGTPVPGRYTKETQTLTFNAGETAGAAGKSFLEAVEAIRDRYEARGWTDESP